MKRILLVFGILLLGMAFVSANGDHASEIEEGRELAESGISCDELSDGQLEAIGEYLMEQMHPGEAHEAMHEIMGMEEGTEYHERVHVDMAKMMYCGENVMMGSGMMGSCGMMGDMMGSGMIGSGGMMGMMSMKDNMMGSGMMDEQNPTQTNMVHGMGSGTMQSMMGNAAFGSGMPFLNYGYSSVISYDLIISSIYRKDLGA